MCMMKSKKVRSRRMKSKRRSSRRISKRSRRVVRKGGSGSPNQPDVDPVAEFDKRITHIPTDENPDSDLITILRDNKKDFIATIDKKLVECIEIIKKHIKSDVQTDLVENPFEDDKEDTFIETAVSISKDIPVELYKPYTQHFIGSFLEKINDEIANNKNYTMNDFKDKYNDTVSTLKLSDAADIDKLWNLVFADKTLNEKKLRYVKLVVYHIHDKTYKLNYMRQLANALIAQEQTPAEPEKGQNSSTETTETEPAEQTPAQGQNSSTESTETKPAQGQNPTNDSTSTDSNSTGTDTSKPAQEPKPQEQTPAQEPKPATPVPAQEPKPAAPAPASATGGKYRRHHR